MYVHGVSHIIIIVRTIGATLIKFPHEKYFPRGIRPGVNVIGVVQRRTYQCFFPSSTQNHNYLSFITISYHSCKPQAIDNF